MLRPLVVPLPLLGLVLIPPSLLGQAAAPASAPPTWSVGIIFGAPLSDAAQGAEAFFVAEGWNRPNCSSWFSTGGRSRCSSYPTSDSPGTAYTVDVNYRRARGVGAGIVFSSTTVHRTRGHATLPGQSWGTTLSLARTVRTVAPVATFSGHTGLLQFGPALHSVRSSLGTRQDDRTVIGLLAGGGLRIPLGTSWSLEGRVQYRRVNGAAGVGPVTTQIAYVDPGVGARAEPATVARFEGPASHWFLGVGVGWRR